VFIELIERKSETENKDSEQKGFFAHDNMSGLAKTMNSYLDSDTIDQSTNIRKLDDEEYFSTAQTILIQDIQSLNISTSDVAKAKGFLHGVLGFEFDDQQMVNPNERQKYLEFNKASEFGEGVIPVELSLKASDAVQTKSVLDKLELSYEEDHGCLKLDRTYAGYPMKLVY
jgi:hypothetical protein